MKPWSRSWNSDTLSIIFTVSHLYERSACCHQDLWILPPLTHYTAPFMLCFFFIFDSFITVYCLCFSLSSLVRSTCQPINIRPTLEIGHLRPAMHHWDIGVLQGSTFTVGGNPSGYTDQAKTHIPTEYYTSTECTATHCGILPKNRYLHSDKISALVLI